MEIDGAIQTLDKIIQSIDREIPRAVSNPDALVDYLNRLYVNYSDDLNLDEVFEYDDVGRPSITLTINIDVEFDIKTVMENMKTRLRIEPQKQADDIEKTGVVWSFRRYDFVYDDESGNLRISHRYSHKHKNTRSVLSITKRMIGYARDYLEEVGKSIAE
jgi:hypothetical protein